MIMLHRFYFKEDKLAILFNLVLHKKNLSRDSNGLNELHESIQDNENPLFRILASHELQME